MASSKRKNRFRSRPKASKPTASPNANNNSAVEKALSMLKRVRRLDGVALISGGVTLHEDYPPGTDARTFSQSAVQMYEDFAGADQHPENIHFAYDGGQMLFVHRSPVILCLFFERDGHLESVENGAEQFMNQFSQALGISGSHPVSVYPDFSADAPDVNAQSAPQPEVDTVSVQEAEVIEETIEEPAPKAELMLVSEYESWLEFRRRVEVLFSKVLGSAQAKRIITRELDRMGIGQAGYLKHNQYRPFGQKLTKRIRDRRVRRQIDDELVSIVVEFTD